MADDKPITAKDLGSLWASLGAMLRENNKATIEAAKATAATVDEGNTKSKGLFKGLASTLGGIFKKGGAAEKEKENKENRFRKMMLKPLHSMVDGIKNMSKSLKEKAKAAYGGLKKMIIKGAMMVGVAALLAFVNSPLFEKLKTWVVDKLMPGMKKAVDIVVDIAKTVTEWVKVAVDWIVLAFTNPLAVLNSLWTLGSSIGQFIWDTVVSPVWTWFTTLFTDPVTALKQLVSGYGSLVDWVFRNAFIKPWNWITGLFGFEPIANNFSLWETISAVFTEVKTWFIDLFKWGRALGTTKDGVWSLSTMIDNAFQLVKDWVIGLFDWARAAGTTADGKWSLASMIDAAFLKVKAWAVSLFTWLLAPEGESWIQKTVSAAVDLVKKWALSLFAWSSKDNPDDPWLTKKVKDAINLVKDWAIGLFAWVSTAGKVDGEEWSLSTMIDSAVNAVIGWAKSLFLWSTEPVGPEDSWIKKTVHAVVQKVKDWAISLFTWANTDEVTDPPGFGIVSMIKGVIKTAIGWITGLFTWVSTKGQVDGEDWSVITLVQEIIGKAISWVKSIFSWATTDEKTEPEKWSIFGTVKAVIKSAIGWVTGLFSWAAKAGEVDGEAWSLTTMMSAALKKIKEFFWHPDGKSGILQFNLADALPDFKMPDLGRAVAKLLANIFPDKWVLGEGIVGTAVNWAMPDSLIAMLKDIKGLAGGGFLPADTMAIVGEKGPELFMSKGPGTVISNDFAKAAFNAAAAGSRGGQGGGTVVNNVVNNQPMTQSAVANTKVETAVGLSDPFTQSARAY